MFYVYVQNKLVITTDTKDIAKKIAIQHGFKNFEITETKKADDNANENGYFLEPVKNGFKICEPKPKEKTLDKLKSEKLSQLTSLCHNFDDRLVNNDMYVISSLGFKVNADIRSQNNLKGLIAINADTVNFVDYNNEIHKLKASDLNTLLVECSKNGENLYMQKWAYAEKIKACKTIAELEKISFDFKMLDFSEVVDEVLA